MGRADKGHGNCTADCGVCRLTRPVHLHTASNALCPVTASQVFTLGSQILAFAGTCAEPG
jgi:hypothetical protein